MSLYPISSYFPSSTSCSCRRLSIPAVAPILRTASEAAAFASRQHPARSSPSSSPAIKPLAKQSPAPVVSTAPVKKAGD